MTVMTEESIESITLLDLDHPGANDPAYRRRRDEIAALASAWRLTPSRIPDVAYTDEEAETWRTVVSRLDAKHAGRASAAYLRAKKKLAIVPERVPQLSELDDRIARFHGFRLAPVEGLIDSRAFLAALGDGVMRCTQYLRHASRPEYTPEPDLVHEVVGHVPTFTDADFVAFTRLVGRAARTASDERLTCLERLYWFTIEFGLIREQGELKAFGAGLLSSLGEIDHCFGPEVERRPFAMTDVLASPFDFSAMQPRLFVIDSFAALREETEALLRTF
jgi:phenylalanine-4-hydroxylase